MHLSLYKIDRELKILIKTNTVTRRWNFGKYFQKSMNWKLSGIKNKCTTIKKNKKMLNNQGKVTR